MNRDALGSWNWCALLALSHLLPYMNSTVTDIRHTERQYVGNKTNDRDK